MQLARHFQILKSHEMLTKPFTVIDTFKCCIKNMLWTGQSQILPSNHALAWTFSNADILKLFRQLWTFSR